MDEEKSERGGEGGKGSGRMQTPAGNTRHFAEVMEQHFDWSITRQSTIITDF